MDLNSSRLTEKESLARSKLCLPLDNQYDLRNQTLPLVQRLSPYVGLFKIGKGSYTRFGHDIIKVVQYNGADVFLDLKYHDIPNTVEDAADAATGLDVYMFNVHAKGGLDMMRAAKNGAKKRSEKYGNKMPKIVAVTELTTLDEPRFLEVVFPLIEEMEGVDFADLRKYAEMGKDEMVKEELKSFLKKHGLEGIIKNYVLHLATLTDKAGLDGIVCSPQEVSHLKGKLREDFIYATPGVRLPGAPKHDQQRVMPPGEAIENGSSIIIAGRPILEAEDQAEAAYKFLQDMALYL